MALPCWFTNILEHYEVPYEEAPDPAAGGRNHGYRAAETIVLNVDGCPAAVVAPATARADLDRVRAVLGEELRPAEPEELRGWFRGCAPGAVPPLRLRSDLTVLMDRSLAGHAKLTFAVGEPGNRVAIRFRDWYRMVRPGVGRFTPAAPADRPPAVLVVEDEAVTNMMLCRLLERAGFTCHGARDGRRALELAAAVRPAAVLLDLMLPDMSGFEVYEALRRSGPARTAPVIVLTALDDEDTRQHSLRLGADAFLTKPVCPDALVTELQGVLADARA